MNGAISSTMEDSMMIRNLGDHSLFGVNSITVTHLIILL